MPPAKGIMIGYAMLTKGRGVTKAPGPIVVANTLRAAVDIEAAIAALAAVNVTLNVSGVYMSRNVRSVNMRALEVSAGESQPSPPVQRPRPGANAVEVDLMQPLDPDKKPAVHATPLNHVGLWVDDLPRAVEWMSANGVRFAPGGIRRNYYADIGEDALIMWAHDLQSPEHAARVERLEAALPRPLVTGGFGPRTAATAAR